MALFYLLWHRNVVLLHRRVTTVDSTTNRVVSVRTAEVNPAILIGTSPTAMPSLVPVSHVNIIHQNIIHQNSMVMGRSIGSSHMLDATHRKIPHQPVSGAMSQILTDLVLFLPTGSRLMCHPINTSDCVYEYVVKWDFLTSIVSQFVHQDRHDILGHHNQSFGGGQILKHLLKKLFSHRDVTRGWFATTGEKKNFGGENAVCQPQEFSTAIPTNTHKLCCRNDIRWLMSGFLFIR